MVQEMNLKMLIQIVTAQYENIEISQEDLELSIDAYRLRTFFHWTSR